MQRYYILAATGTDIDKETLYRPHADFFFLFILHICAFSLVILCTHDTEMLTDGIYSFSLTCDMCSSVNWSIYCFNLATSKQIELQV